MYRIIVKYNNGVICDMIDNYYNNAIELGKRYCNNASVESVSIYNRHNDMLIAQGGQGLLIDALFGEIL